MPIGTKARIPHLSLPPTETRDLRKRILKLRWMGMESEAEYVSQQILAASVPMAGFQCWPHDTD
jgi:hypothetical protein